MASQARVEHGWIERIMVMLGSVDHTEVQSWSISKVRDKLRKPNEDAYTPKVVSIGPLHRGIGRNIQAMEEIKWSYMLSLLMRQSASPDPKSPEVGSPDPKSPDARSPDPKSPEAGSPDPQSPEVGSPDPQSPDATSTDAQRPDAETVLRRCGKRIERLDMLVRPSYGVNIENEPHDLATIMLVDGCFLLEFLHRLDKYRVSRTDAPNDPIFGSEEKLMSVLSDLSLLENQLPFFVLKNLYAILFPDKNHNNNGVADLALRAFGSPSTNATRIAHLLHLMHLASVNVESQNLPETDNSCTIDAPGQSIQRQSNQCQLNRCASELIAAGITLQAEPEGHRDPWGFSFYANRRSRRGVLVISPLVITEITEAKWRNFIAWEYNTAISRQADKTGQTKRKVISYAFLFKGLICCGHDIDVLENKGIIVNPSKKSKQDLLALFRKITEGVEPHMVDSSFSEMCKALNTFPTSDRTLRVQILGWHYWKRFVEWLVEWLVNVRKFVKRDYHFVATFLALLSVVQTIYAVLSYHRPNH